MKPKKQTLEPSVFPEVALLIETSTTYGRDVLRGIHLFMQENRPWRVRLEQRSIHESIPSWLPDWKGHGILSRVPVPKLAELSKKNGIPIVDMNEQIIIPGLPLVFNDQEMIGKMAAQHLLDLQFTHFAYIGQKGGYWSDKRLEGFCEVINAKGFPVDEFHGRSRTITGYQKRLWETETELVASWVERLPKPVGIMTCNAFRGMQLQEACQMKSLAIPEQVTIIAGDNEEIACEMSLPPLSAVVNSGRMAGYVAASMLEKLMRKERLGQQQVFIPPSGIVVRASSKTIAVSNDIVRTCVRYIRENAALNIMVADVAKHVDLSETKLQRLFKKTLNCTVHDAILNTKINIASELLKATELSLEEIALKSGFNYVQHMSDVFKKVVGMRPGYFRKWHKGSVHS